MPLENCFKSIEIAELERFFFYRTYRPFIRCDKRRYDSPINSRPLFTGWRTSPMIRAMLIYSARDNNTWTSKWRGTRSIETRRRSNRGGGAEMKWKRFARSQTWIVPRLFLLAPLKIPILNATRNVRQPYSYSLSLNPRCIGNEKEVSHCWI